MMPNATRRLWAATWVWAPAALFCLILAPAVAPAAQTSKTIENISPWPHRAPLKTSPGQLVAAITLAAEKQEWRVIGEAPGAVIATLVRRSHEAVVTIGYDELNFWIDYKDSKNLNYSPNDLMGRRKSERFVRTKGPRIHPNYNLWVAELAEQIELQMQNPPKVSDDPPPLLIGDELEKLDQLRQRGVLTQEEFDKQKARLLAL